MTKVDRQVLSGKQHAMGIKYRDRHIGLADGSADAAYQFLDAIHINIRFACLVREPGRASGGVQSWGSADKFLSCRAQRAEHSGYIVGQSNRAARGMPMSRCIAACQAGTMPIECNKMSCLLVFFWLNAAACRNGAILFVGGYLSLK
ncbi:hypothetical protein PQU95_10055 [Vogesella sp. DC21W]|uniref:Uncharacterized protein n=1 Tax=Vogesella aquatica TaxID=2984206 RepID=A0ABT5IY97_9NEIS|nr:hypothetical protein [Vogesella aquatica]MDC7717554.1 hypothetical protein [Vogesella aquatica]